MINSIHGKSEAINRLIYALQNDSNSNNTLFYVNKQKTTNLLKAVALTLPQGNISIPSGFIHKLTDSGSPVKNKFIKFANRQIPDHHKTKSTIRHGLDGNKNRFITNSRLTSVIGEVIKNAIPINALKNKANGVVSTYAMAGLSKDNKGREFVTIITIEQRNDKISALETYDVAHSINGRQRRSSESGTKPQGVYPYNAASTISIKDFINKVKETHKSILSNDVLNRFEETKPENGLYSGQSMFSLGDKKNTFVCQ